MQLLRMPDDLSHGRLLDIVEQIQLLLYWDFEKNSFDPNKPWDSGTISLISQVLDDYGLVPKEGGLDE